MRKLFAFILICFSAITSFAQNAVVQSAPIAPSQENFWTPEKLWIMICAVMVMGFIFLIIYALSSAAISLSHHVGKKFE